FHPRPAFRQDEQSDRCQQQPGDDRPGPGERDPRLAGPEPDAQGGSDERRPEPVRAARPGGTDDLPLAELGQLPVDVVEERVAHLIPPPALVSCSANERGSGLSAPTLPRWARYSAPIA